MATDIIFNLEVNDGDAVKSLNKVDDSVQDIGKSAEKTAKSTKSFGTTLANLGKAAGIVGLLVTAFEVLKEALGNNQKIMDTVNTATTALNIVFNDLFSLIADNFTPAVEYVVGLFSDLPGTLEKVKDAIYNNIEVRFNALIKTFGLLGDAINKVFSGDFSGAMESAGEAAETYVDVLTGVEGTVDKVVDGVNDLVDSTINYTTETLKAADSITQLTKSSRILELQQTRLREAADRDAETQRQIRDDYTKNIDDRIAANQRLATVLDEQEAAEKATVQARINALQQEQAQLGFKQERYEEIYALNTELIAIEAQQAGFRSEQEINAINLLKEKAELQGFQTQAQLEAYELEIKLAEDAQAKREKIAAEELKTAKAAAKAKEDINKQTADASVQVAGAALNAIAQAAGEGTEIAKAAGIAGVVIDTIQGGIKAFNSMAAIPIVGPALGAIAAAAVGVSGALAVQNITQTKVGDKTIKKTPAPNIPSTASVLPPDFNVEQTNQNQLGDVISDELNNQPNKSYVVSEDVTSQQQMDRVALSNSTL